MAAFFGIAGGLTAIGPLAGGFLIELTWRSIFWINVPVAIVAVILTLRRSRTTPAARPRSTTRAPSSPRSGSGCSCSASSSRATGAGTASRPGAPSSSASILIGVFVRVELGTDPPLMQVRIFANKAFAADNIVLFLISIAFVPMFLFASMYSQISLGFDPSNAGLYIGIFFAGFVIAAQWGGRMLDRGGARAPVVLGCAIAAVGFYLWARSMPDLASARTGTSGGGS